MVAFGVKQQDTTATAGDYRARDVPTLRQSDYKAQAVASGFSLLERIGSETFARYETNRISGAINKIKASDDALIDQDATVAERYTNYKQNIANLSNENFSQTDIKAVRTAAQFNKDIITVRDASGDLRSYSQQAKSYVTDDPGYDKNDEAIDKIYDEAGENLGELAYAQTFAPTSFESFDKYISDPLETIANGQLWTEATQKQVVKKAQVMSHGIGRIRTIFQQLNRPINSALSPTDDAEIMSANYGRLTMELSQIRSQLTDDFFLDWVGKGVNKEAITGLWRSFVGDMRPHLTPKILKAIGDSDGTKISKFFSDSETYLNQVKDRVLKEGDKGTRIDVMNNMVVEKNLERDLREHKVFRELPEETQNMILKADNMKHLSYAFGVLRESNVDIKSQGFADMVIKAFRADIQTSLNSMLSQWERGEWPGGEAWVSDIKRIEDGEFGMIFDKKEKLDRVTKALGVFVTKFTNKKDATQAEKNAAERVQKAINTLKDRRQRMIN